MVGGLSRTRRRVGMNLDALLRADEAAAYFRCDPRRIHRWRSLGHIEIAGRDDRGILLYRLGDLLEAERKTRRSPNSRRALAAA